MKALTIGVLAMFAFFTPQNQLAAQAGGGGQAETKENLDLPYDALALSEDEEEAPEVIVFYGNNYEGDGIFYCLDRSGSTNAAHGNEIEREKQEVIRNINDFSKHVQFAVVFYDQGVIRHPASGRPAEANEGAKAAARAWVMTQQSGHGTCVNKGLSECLDFANFSSAKRNVIIYLGDGCMTCPNNRNEAQYTQQTLAEVQAKNFKKHQINAIVVGSEICESFPKALAAMHQGSYKKIPR